MTEDQARGKWCPFARVTDNIQDGVAVNRFTEEGVIDHEVRCVASACMAWRVLRPLANAEGFCGLAGDPRP